MNILNLIDHTVLKAFSTSKDIDKICSEALPYNFASVCINPVWIKQATTLLSNPNSEGHKIAIRTVIGSPLGASATETKVAETMVKAGATRLGCSSGLKIAQEIDT